MGRLRIVAGELRGRLIEVPSGVTVRPTADRVREALFSILGARVCGASVLDAYSGSGALGFEALSRGAARVVFVEANRLVLAGLIHNAEKLHVRERCRFRAAGAAEWLAREAEGEFELILADPPYGSGEGSRFLPRAAPHLAAGGTLVIERDGRDPQTPAPSGLSFSRSLRYGRMCLDFYGAPA